MSDPKIIYTAILIKQTILVDLYEETGEIINHVKERVLGSTNILGQKVINEDGIIHLYV